MEQQVQQNPNPPRPPLLTRPELVIIWILSALLLAGVAALEVRDAMRERSGLRVEHCNGEDMRYLIDLNTATWQELALLPGIGKSKAKEIIAQRERIGGFQSRSQLTEVKGISRLVIERIIPMVTVSRPKQPGEKR